MTNQDPIAEAGRKLARKELIELEPTTENLEIIAGKSDEVVTSLALVGIWREMWMLRTLLDGVASALAGEDVVTSILAKAAERSEREEFHVDGK